MRRPSRATPPRLTTLLVVRRSCVLRQPLRLRGLRPVPVCGFVFQPGRASAEERRLLYDAATSPTTAPSRSARSATTRLTSSATPRRPGACTSSLATWGAVVSWRSVPLPATSSGPLGRRASHPRRHRARRHRGGNCSRTGDTCSNWHPCRRRGESDRFDVGCRLARPGASTAAKARSRTVAFLVAFPGGGCSSSFPTWAASWPDEKTQHGAVLDADAHVAHYDPALVRQVLRDGGFDVDRRRDIQRAALLHDALFDERCTPSYDSLVALGTAGLMHPTRHELMRVAARRPLEGP